MPGAVTIFVDAPLAELERRLRGRATESAGEIDERIALAAEQKQLRRPLRLRGRERRPRARRGRVRCDRGTRARRGSYHGASMIHPRIDQLLDQVDSRYALVIVAAKRARQINNYHHQLGEGTFDEFAPPLVAVALEELPDACPSKRSPRARSSTSTSDSAGGNLRFPPTSPPSDTWPRVAGERRQSRHSRRLAVRPAARKAQSRDGRILLGVTGGIAAYKACELTRLLVKSGHDVMPLVTPGAERFVRAETFLALARRPAQRGSLRAPDSRRPARRRAVHGEHARQARSRARRQPARPRRRSPIAGRCSSRRR